MRDIITEGDVECISLEAEGPVVAVVDDGDGDDVDEMVLDDICEVVISLKCKQCQFLCNEKSTLATHIKQVHSQKRAKESTTTTKVPRNTSHGDQNVKVDCEPSSTVVKPKTSEKCSRCPSKEDLNANEKKAESCKNREENGNSLSTSISNDCSQSSPSPTPENGKSDSSETIILLDEIEHDVFLCAQCDIVFSSGDMCCSHMHNVHGLNQFSADFIQEEIISKPTEAQNSKRGRKTKLPKQFSAESGTIVPKKYRVTKDIFHMCSKCSIKFESVEIMKFHEQCHKPTTQGTTRRKGFLCPVCESNGVRGKFFPKWASCSWHLWKIHRIDCELYTCSVCKQFKSYLVSRVKDHEQLHSTKASYKCKTCSKTFKQMKQLRCHEKYHKDNSTKLAPEVDSRWYTPKECPICKRILSDSKCLKKHISAVHNKLKPYVCNICGHTSARKAELQLHIRQHTGEKPYKCSTCPFETGDHNSLRKHKLRHSDKRPYACSYCDYRCIQSCAFKKHILAVHPGQEVVFVCQLCSHASVNEALFNVHQKDHAEGRIPSKDSNEPEVEDATNKRTSSSPSSSNVSEQKDKDDAQCWSGDEDSLDIIDNGGVTIVHQSPPPPPADTNNSHMHVSGDKQSQKVLGGEVKQPQNGSLNTPQSFNESRIGAHKNIKNSFEVSPSSSQTTSSAVATKGKHKDTLTFFKSNNGTTSSSIGKRVSVQQERQFLVPLVFSASSSLPQRHEKVNALVITSSINTSEDTESSSSEVITNTHQLIQNIQLTPLDLTDIISCNEQSNDDGMLQRLLDMSGV